VTPRRAWLGAALGSALGAAVAMGLSSRRRDTAALAPQPDAERSALLGRALYAGRMGTWSWDATAQRLDWDTDLEQLFGLGPGSFEGTFDAWLSRLHPDDRQHVVRMLAVGSEPRGVFRVEYRCVWPDGSIHWLEGIGDVTTHENGELRHAFGVVADIDERRRAEAERARLLSIERDARERADYLAGVSDALVRSLDLEDLITRITAAAVPARAEWCSLVLTADQPPASPITALAHVDPDMVVWARRLQERFPFDPDASFGAAKVIRTGTTQLRQIDDQALEASIDDPALREAVRNLDLRSVIIVALQSPLGILGSLLLARTAASEPYDEHDVAVAEDFARTIGVALNNALLFRRQQRARNALDVIAQLTGALAVAVTEDDVIQTVISRGTAGVDADRAVLYLLDDEGVLRLAAHTGFTDADLAAWALADWQTIDLEASAPIPDAVRQRSMVVIDDGREIARRYPYMAHSPIRDAAIIALPVEIRGAVLGGLMFAFTKPHVFTDEEVAMLQTLVGRCAGSLERARLFDRQRETSLTLQRRLLPELPPPPDWLDAGALYQPATGGEVGGDWYQLLVLADGCCGAALGDAVGRGVPAAAAMGQLRAVMTGAAAVDHDPASVLSAVDAFALTGADTRGASLVYGLIERDAARLRYACAGHPPPVLLCGDRPARLLEAARRPLLGVPGLLASSAPPPVADVEFGPGDTLVLYSDGLVERRDQSIDAGLDRLLRAAERSRTLAPDELCAALLAECVGATAVRDDVAILAIRRVR
jgi:PAS domain S-box-containing protein